MPMGYTYLEHTTDVIVQVNAETMEEAFVYAAESVVDTTLDIKRVSAIQTRNIMAQGKDMHLVLLDWLETVNYVLITEGFAACKFDVHIEGNSPYTIHATAHGEKIDIIKHKFKIEIKAPTLHMMKVIQNEDSVQLQFLLDL